MLSFLAFALGLSIGHSADDVADAARRIVSQERLLQTVRELVACGPRMGGTESGLEAAAYLQKRFEELGLEVTTVDDPEMSTYEPKSWKVVARSGDQTLELKSAWPYLESPSGQLENVALAVTGSPGDELEGKAVLTKGHVARAYGRWAAVKPKVILCAYPDDPEKNPDWTPVYRLRRAGDDAVPVFGISHHDAEKLRTLAEDGTVSIDALLEAESGRGQPRTVIAEIPGVDPSRHLLFCAHGDSDGGGPGADDNASGEAVVVEIATAWKKLLDEGLLDKPEVSVRFIIWGAEIHSTRAYLNSERGKAENIVAVINYDQAGTGASRDAIYVEPDDVEANGELVAAFHRVLKRHHEKKGFWSEYASNKSLGGTDSYVFQSTRATGGHIVPAVTVFSSAFGSPSIVDPTPGIEQPGWKGDPDKIVVDYSRVYHASGDTPLNTTEKEPFNLERCALAGLLGALEMLAGLEKR
ncbi:MAG: M28 family peptidase [Planctomycetota bacterium]